MRHIKRYSHLNESFRQASLDELDPEVIDILNIAKDDGYPMDAFFQFGVFTISVYRPHTVTNKEFVSVMKNVIDRLDNDEYLDTLYPTAHLKSRKLDGQYQTHPKSFDKVDNVDIDYGVIRRVDIRIGATEWITRIRNEKYPFNKAK